LERVKCFAPRPVMSHLISLLDRSLPTLVLPAALCLAGVNGTTLAQSAPLSDDAQMAVVERVGEMLAERYVFPDVAAQCIARLRVMTATKEFSEATDPDALGAWLTEALRSVSHDKHLLVRVRAAAASPTPAGSELALRERARRLSRGQQGNFGFERVERLEGNIGYLDLRSFAGPRDAQTTAVSAMGFLANTDAVIFDLRRNEGGSPGMVQFLSSYLFAEPTHLNTLYFREGDRVEEYWTLPDVPGAKLPDVPVFVLTSAKTFSAAEEFSYNLLTQKRATLVGETTRGGANPGGLFPIDARFEMVIPTGRAINPITGTNWEGTGVEPQVAVPAERALEAALELARPAAEARRSAREAQWSALEAAYGAALRLDDARRLDDTEKRGDAARALGAGLEAARRAGLIDELDVDGLGYDLLGQGRNSLAIAAFELNVATSPSSAKAHDSLGEALKAAGDVGGAIRCYERALELDPAGPHAEAARTTLAELKAIEDR
jgi:tetratricopeptide (TPR) repeat protein